MMFARLVLANQLKQRNEVLVDRVDSRQKGIYYSVNKSTREYSFWRVTGLHNVRLLGSHLDRLRAQFKVLLLK